MASLANIKVQNVYFLLYKKALDHTRQKALNKTCMNNPVSAC
jgi:hypothetical protein